MTKEALTYYHAALNYTFFAGELEPAIFDFTEKDDGVTATFIDVTDPFLIEFDEEFINECDDDIFILTIMLHEMIHEYCYMFDICDIDEYSDDHSEEFVEVAEDHGLTFNGYKLTDNARNKIENIIASYNAVKGTCE